MAKSTKSSRKKSAAKTGTGKSTKTPVKKAVKKVKVEPEIEVAAGVVKLPNSFKLTEKVGLILWENKKPLLGITAIYAVLNLLFVQGLSTSNSNVSLLKLQFKSVAQGHISELGAGMSSLLGMAGSSGNTNADSGVYQLFFFLIISLAIIWALRQLLSGQAIRIRDAYYKGMYPLVPFILVLVVISIQLLPLIVGSTLYGLAVSNSIATSIFEKAIFFIIFILLSTWSLRMITSSLFAAYIVTLPDMTPIKALRSAKGLVKGRRLSLIRKILWLPLILVVLIGIIMLPIILVLTPIASWVFFVLTAITIVVAHTYLYNLYREML